MEWTATIEGPDEFGEIQRAQVQIEKGFERLASGEIGLSIDDGKRIMSALQEFVVKEELATYALARRVCVSWRCCTDTARSGVWAGGGGRRRFVKLPSGFPSNAEQAQRRSPASFREDEIQDQELGFV